MSGPVTRLGVPITGLPRISTPVAGMTLHVMPQAATYRSAPTPPSWRPPSFFMNAAQRVTAIARGGERLALMNSLEANEVESANSYLENVASHLHQSVQASGDGKMNEEFRALLGSDPTLEDLYQFATATGLDLHYGLASSGPAVLDRFLQRAGKLRSLEYQLGAGRVRDVFTEALADSRLGPVVQRVLKDTETSPLPLLRMNRLFHLLLDRQTEYKLAELLDWKGGLGDGFTGFAPVAAAAQTLNQVLLGKPFPGCRRSHPMTLSQRREHWMDGLVATRPCGDLTHPLRIAALLGRQESETARRLSLRIVQQYIRIQVVSPVQMAKVLEDEKGKTTAPGHEIEAIYVMPNSGHPVPTIYLLNLFEVYPAENPIDLELALVANALHEFVHIELEQGGMDLNQYTLVPIEMIAHTTDTTLRVANGDDTFHRQISGLSPYGYLMGLRNFIEFDYLRRRIGFST